MPADFHWHGMSDAAIDDIETEHIQLDLRLSCFWGDADFSTSSWHSIQLQQASIGGYADFMHASIGGGASFQGMICLGTCTMHGFSAASA